MVKRSHHIWLCLPLQGTSSFYRQRREEAYHASSNDANRSDQYKLHTLVTSGRVILAQYQKRK